MAQCARFLVSVFGDLSSEWSVKVVGCIVLSQLAFHRFREAFFTKHVPFMVFHYGFVGVVRYVGGRGGRVVSIIVF